jgi:hypothetical protein
MEKKLMLLLKLQLLLWDCLFEMLKKSAYATCNSIVDEFLPN